MFDVGQIIPPEPNADIPGKFVLECLATESEGDGMLYAALFKGKMLYAKSSGAWYYWSGHSWSVDRIDIAIGLVRHVCDRYGEEIAVFEEKIEKSRQESDPEDHKISKKSFERRIGQLQGKIKALRKGQGRNACLEFARTNLGNPFTITGEEFDKDPWLLGCSNGVIDLRSGDIYPGRPDQYVSKLCGCEYLGIKVDMSGWLEFLNTIYGGDEELIEFLQRLLGYGITGLTTEHVFPFLLGRGRNGKSLFMESIMRVLGEYAVSIPSDLFLQSNAPRNPNQADPAIMMLEGRRLAVSSEVEEGSKFSAQMVKKLTGGDDLVGRNPYDKSLREFSPTHLTMMIGNHEPTPPTGDPAFWDRTFLIRHNVRFVKHPPEKENEVAADPKIEEKLEKLDTQILAWLVEGCVKWQGNEYRLDPPASVLKATEEYQEDADFVGQFIETCCIITNPQAKTGGTELYTAFATWFRENINSKKNYTPSQRAFGIKLRARDEYKTSKEKGIVYYNGIALTAEWVRKMVEATRGKDGLPE